MIRMSPPCAFTFSKSSFDPGTRNISPNEQRITSGSPGKLARHINQFNRRDADRAPWAMNDRDFRRKESIESISDNRMCLPSTYLHDGPRMLGDLTNSFSQFLNRMGISKLVHVFHDEETSVFLSSPNLSNMANVSSAACSSTLLIAMPTCTMT